MTSIVKARSRGYPHRGRTGFFGLIGICLLAMALSACAGVHPPIGLSDCYESLPIAEGALNQPVGQYKFRGAKLVRPQDMEAILKRRYPHVAKPPVTVAKGTKVCAFAFTGTFGAGQVADAPVDSSGKAAIVLATTHRQLLFSFVLPRLPEKFSRTFTQ